MLNLSGSIETASGNSSAITAPAEAIHTLCWCGSHHGARTEPWRAQRVNAGRERARSARRHADGRFMSEAEVQEAAAEYARWLHARPGRAGGVARAASAKRLMGTFVKKEWESLLEER
jgi:hypothetical protein